MNSRYEHPLPRHRLHQVSVTIGAIVLTLLLFGASSGRNTLAWIYTRSTEAVTNAGHIRTFSLDRLDPTCPQCM